MENQPQNNQEQEVDLVPVFVWISNGFKNLFNGIGNIFKSIGHFLILFLIFIKKNLIIVALTSILGIAGGWYLKSQLSNVYSAKILVKPNFKSAAQLISNINHYNSLIEQNDYNNLATALKTTQENAAMLTGMEISAEFNETELLQEYDELARESDTMALDNFTFEGFMRAKRDIDYEFHNIQVTANNRDVLENVIPQVISVNENSMIKAQRMALKETADFDLKTKEYQLVEIDSLIAAYESAIKSSDISSGSGTNIHLGDQRPSEALNQLFNQKRYLLEEMSEIREDKYTYDETVHTVSQFITKGTLEKKHYRLKGALVGFGLGLLIALIPVVFRFLNEYEKNNA